MSRKSSNIDFLTVKGFGEEWAAYDQSCLPADEARAHFDAYFACFRWDLVNEHSVGFDMGCGSGRWAKLLAPRIGHLHCIDPSAALDIARRNLAGLKNVSFHSASVDAVPLVPETMDFGVSLGVLHHVPNTAAAIRDCAKLLKPGAPLLLYLYYRFDNRPIWYRGIWRISEMGRQTISRLPRSIRISLTAIIAAIIYWPLGRLAALIAAMGIDPHPLPLAQYRNASFYTMRTDALDRFGTRLEQRFTQREIADMLHAAGFIEVRFSPAAPYWCVCAVRST